MKYMPNTILRDEGTRPMSCPLAGGAGRGFQLIECSFNPFHHCSHPVSFLTLAQFSFLDGSKFNLRRGPHTPRANPPAPHYPPGNSSSNGSDESRGASCAA